MKYFGFMPNDFINGENVSVSLWTAGCHHKCPGCHNSRMWNYDDGYTVPADLDDQLINAITRNGIMRNFSILGGEPLMERNIPFVKHLVSVIRNKFGDKIKIYLWTGYTIEELRAMVDEDIDYILHSIDVLIDGRYIESERDISLALRGSRNQRVIELKGESK